MTGGAEGDSDGDGADDGDGGDFDVGDGSGSSNKWCVCVCVYYLIEFNQCPLSFCDEQSFAATSGDTQSALLCTCLLCLHYELFRLPANVQRWWRWWWRGGSNQIVKYLDSDAAAAAATM